MRSLPLKRHGIESHGVGSPIGQRRSFRKTFGIIEHAGHPEVFKGSVGRLGIIRLNSKRQAGACPVENAHFRFPKVMGLDGPIHVEGFSHQQGKFSHSRSYVEASSFLGQPLFERLGDPAPHGLALFLVGFPKSLTAFFAVNVAKSVIVQPGKDVSDRVLRSDSKGMNVGVPHRQYNNLRQKTELTLTLTLIWRMC